MTFMGMEEATGLPFCHQDAPGFCQDFHGPHQLPVILETHVLCQSLHLLQPLKHSVQCCAGQQGSQRVSQVDSSAPVDEIVLNHFL